jgi:hypothetical protein
MEQAWKTRNRQNDRKRSLLKPAWLEVLLLGLCTLLCSIQLFVPPYIGLANNGDFSKVFSRFAISPPDGGDRNFIYFVSDYEYNPRYLWKSDVKSSENVLAAIPILIARALGARVFNIRWLGALHLLLYLCGYYLLLRYLRRYGPVVSIGVGALALLIFTDVAYVSYFNSFFSDTAALIGLVLMICLVLDGEHSGWREVAFTAAALLFITSKTQHAFWGIFPAALLLSRRRFAGAAVLVIAEAAMLLSTPWTYKTAPLFSVIFYKLAPNAPSPQAAARELGLGRSEYCYIGTHAYTPRNPGTDIPWLRYFVGRTSYAKVLCYWLRHPREAGHALYYDLVTFAPGMRQSNLANFRREDGRPPGELSRRFAVWSSLREAVYRRWPFSVAVWYAGVIACAIAAIRRHRTQAMVCLGVAAMGILEFCFASLADAVETDRHLLLFHALTDVTICFAAAWALDALSKVRRSRGMRTAFGESAHCPPETLVNVQRS